MTGKELLSAVRTAQGLPSNYALARAVGIPERSLQRWNTGSHTPDDATAARLAELAGLDPDSVVAAMHAQRAADDQERSRWERIARRLEGSGVAAALAVCAVLSLWTSGGPDGGASLLAGLLPALVDSGVSPLYIVHCGIAGALLLALLLRSRFIPAARGR